jgi:hypothetical protein
VSAASQLGEGAAFSLRLPFFEGEYLPATNLRLIRETPETTAR